MDCSRKLTISVCWLFLLLNGYLPVEATGSRQRKVQMHLQSQIDNLRTEMSMLQEDLAVLLDNGAASTTVSPELTKSVEDNSFQSAIHDDSKKEKCVQVAQTCSRVIKAFAIEKRMNVEFRNEFSELKQTVTGELEKRKMEYERYVTKMSDRVLEDMRNIQENIKEVANASKSELNQRILKLQENMQDDINQKCVIPLASTADSLNKTQSVLKVLSDNVANFRSEINFVCNPNFETGIHNISLPEIKKSVSVLCDGGWAIIFRWKETFRRVTKAKEQYNKGFRDSKDNLWLGLEHLHILTMRNGRRLYIKMTYRNGTEETGSFDNFQLESVGENYKVYFGRFDGSLAHASCFQNATLIDFALFEDYFYSFYIARHLAWLPFTRYCMLYGRVYSSIGYSVTVLRNVVNLEMKIQ